MLELQFLETILDVLRTAAQLHERFLGGASVEQIPIILQPAADKPWSETHIRFDPVDTAIARIVDKFIVYILGVKTSSICSFEEAGPMGGFPQPCFFRILVLNQEGTPTEIMVDTDLLNRIFASLDRRGITSVIIEVSLHHTYVVRRQKLDNLVLTVEVPVVHEGQLLEQRLVVADFVLRVRGACGRGRGTWV